MTKIIEIEIDLKAKWYDPQKVKVDEDVFILYARDYISTIPDSKLQRFYLGGFNGRELYEHAYWLNNRSDFEKSILESNPELGLKELPFYTWASMDRAIFSIIGKEVRPVLKQICQEMFEKDVKSKISQHELDGVKIRFVKKEETTYVIPEDLFKSMTFIDYSNIDYYIEENNLKSMQL